MKLTEYSLNRLKEYISGDNKITPSQSGKAIIEIFNSVGFRDVYAAGMPEGLSRNAYILDRLKACNDSKKLKLVLEIVFSSRHFELDNTLDLEDAVKKVNELISPEGYCLTKANGNYLISSQDSYKEDTSSEIHFEQLRNLLKAELRKAKYAIWVAVAWFTDKDLFDILSQKQEEGLSVQVLILDDDINANSGIEYDKGFYTWRVKKTGKFGNIMHHKFCIIDLKTVVHGSYNWTNKAQYNQETLDVELNRENAEKFADEFMRIKKMLKVTNDS